MDQPRDRWAAGDAYEAYMGRWSRALARGFLAWLARRPPATGWRLAVEPGRSPPPSAIPVGTSVGAWPATRRSPSSNTPASKFSDPLARFQSSPRRDALPSRAGGFDARGCAAWCSTSCRTRERRWPPCGHASGPGATVAAYVWDYAGGVEFLRHFWAEAVATSTPARPPSMRANALASGKPPALASLFSCGRTFPRCETEVLEIAHRLCRLRGLLEAVSRRQRPRAQLRRVAGFAPAGAAESATGTAASR